MGEVVHSSRGTIRTSRALVLILLLVITGTASALWALKSGYPAVSWKELWRVLLNREGSDLAVTSILELRLPRIVLGFLSGAMLAISGVLMQTGLRNPLASPDLIGVSAGSSLIIAVITVLHLPVAFSLYPLFGLVGGFTGGLIVIASVYGRTDSTSIILMGTAVTAMLNGMIVWLITMGTQNDINLLYTYLMGSLSGRHWNHVQYLLPWAVIGIPAAMLFIKPLNLLRLGDEQAEALGQKVARLRLLLLVASGVMVSAVVAQCGPIGYIALLGPYLTRAILGTEDARWILPCSAAVGAVLLVTADLFAKTVFIPREVPVGLWTTMVGVPVLILMLVMRGRRRN
ncbi:MULTISPECIES: FecCD family ABC transporter permease [Paenibacillus]|uniref:ABC transporter permease n=1 Tax=Paenibacillus campinasensis TaxID=66347 RepID=A0A268F048_9BACL|nr:iron ABC transporter permease [Paenibacillus campinasensis]PAD78740.1 ABC transporter permease [Paenibacillus campinasensis]